MWHRRLSAASWYFRIGRLLREKGRIDEADRSVLKARKHYETVLNRAAEAPDDQADLVMTLTFIARDGYETRDYRRAVDCSRRVIGILSRLARAQPGSTSHRADLGWHQNNLGSALWFVGDYRGSAEAHRLGNIAYSELLKAEPGNLAYRDSLAICQTNLGNAFRESGQTDAAVESYRQAIASGSELIRASPDTHSYRMTLARALNNLGWILQRASHHDEAQQAYRQAIDQARFAFDRAPQVIDHRSMLSEAYSGLASSLRALGDADEAAQVTRARREMWQGHPEGLYRIACDLAQCAAIATDAERKRLIVAEAIGALREAVAAGWNDAGRIGRDTDLAPLRDCDEFRKLLAELFDRVFPADPFAR